MDLDKTVELCFNIEWGFVSGDNDNYLERVAECLLTISIGTRLNYTLLFLL